MTLAALPVPVEPSSHLPWFDRIDAFIGDEQSLDDNVSTFTAQIDHLAKAWKHFDSRSLVLLDEFGSGTDPAQGAALAQGVLDELINKHTFVLTATHFPALKGYALTREHARAASMLFNPDTVCPSPSSPAPNTICFRMDRTRPPFCTSSTTSQPSGPKNLSI